MSIQSTLGQRAFRPVHDVPVENCTTPVDGEIPNDSDADWTRITDFRESETFLFPFKGQEAWVGGYQLDSAECDQLHEVGVYRFSQAKDYLDADAELGVWFVHWNGAPIETEFPTIADVGHFTPSLRDARLVIATLLTNIGQAVGTESRWEPRVKHMAHQVDTMSINDYQQAHAEAREKHVSWPAQREQIHLNARLERRNRFEYRARLMRELEHDYANNPGVPVREVLPFNSDVTTGPKQRFVNGEITTEELELALGKAWASESLVTFDEYLDQE